MSKRQRRTTRRQRRTEAEVEALLLTPDRPDVRGFRGIDSVVTIGGRTATVDKVKFSYSFESEGRETEDKFDVRSIFLTKTIPGGGEVKDLLDFIDEDVPLRVSVRKVDDL